MPRPLIHPERSIWSGLGLCILFDTAIILGGLLWLALR